METIQIKNSNKNLADWFLAKLIKAETNMCVKIRSHKYMDGVYTIYYQVEGKQQY